MAKKKNLLNFNSAIILLLILAIFVIIKTVLVPQTTNIEEDARILLDKLTDGNEEMSLLSSEELIEEKLRNLDETDYNEVKSKLGVKSDFCIFFEDISGNLVKIDNLNLGIGSGRIYINGEPCR